LLLCAAVLEDNEQPEENESDKESSQDPFVAL
jgi:hypothetical protein